MQPQARAGEVAVTLSDAITAIAAVGFVAILMLRYLQARKRLQKVARRETRGRPE
jgi:hypothetical protein